MTRLVLLPGMDGTGILFEPFVRALPATLAPLVVAYPPDQVLGYDALLEIVLRSLPLGEPFVLLGESFSGPLALMAAARRPSGLAAVVLCATFVESPLSWFPKVLHPIACAPIFGLTPSFVRRAALLGPEATPELRAVLDRAHALVGPKVMAARARAILGVDVTKALLECPVPLLYLRAAGDRMVSSASWALVSQRRPDVQVETLPGPHLLLQTHPVEAARAIERFLQLEG